MTFSVLSAEPLLGVCQNTAFKTTKWTTCRKKVSINFLLRIFVFTLGGQYLVHLGQNMLSDCVRKTSPIEKFLRIRIQEEEIGNWAKFSRIVGQKFRQGYHNCNLNVRRSIYRYYFFLSIFLFLKLFWAWSVDVATPGGFFSAVFSKLFAKSEDHFEVTFFSKKDLYFF